MSKKTKEMTIPSSIKTLAPAGKRRGRDVYADNPFLESFSIEVRKKSMTIAAGLEIRDQEENEVKVGAIATYKEVDTEEFLKIYTKNIRVLFELSSAAQKILTPLLFEIQKSSKNVAHVFFSHKIAETNCEELGIRAVSPATFSRGIAELLNRQFLAPHLNGDCWYWTNPAILFNGDRIRFIEEYKIKRKAERLAVS